MQYILTLITDITKKYPKLLVRPDRLYKVILLVLLDYYLATYFPVKLTLNRVFIDQLPSFKGQARTTQATSVTLVQY